MLKILMTGYASLLISVTGISAVNAADSGFTGTKSCISCHAGQHLLWQGSHHELAMQHASKDTVLGDFNNAIFSANEVTTRFFIKDGKYFANTDSADGSMKDFEIKYAFGLTPDPRARTCSRSGRCCRCDRPGCTACDRPCNPTSGSRRSDCSHRRSRGGSHRR